MLISGTRNYSELDTLPVIYVDRPSRSQKNSGVIIESDNEQGGYLATKELKDVYFLCGLDFIILRRYAFYAA